jgi:Zn-dependent membrane protease YugP
MWFFYDYYYIALVLPMVVFAMIAQFSVTSTFDRYSKKLTMRGITGEESARMILNANGLSSVRIERVAGKLSDHYDPRANVIRLSSEVYDGKSVAAVGVAAHEAGHAVQYAKGYFPIKLRAAIIPVTNIGSRLSIPLILIGLLFSGSSMEALAYIGVALFSLTTVFQLVTLPVEFNASRRAISALKDSHRFEKEEIAASRKVLSAAAMTYVAALAVSLAQLLRLVLIVGGGRRRR